MSTKEFDESVYVAELEGWLSEARRAARGRPFPRRLTTAALHRGHCHLTATEAVEELGIGIARDWLDGMAWREITRLLHVSTPVALLWAFDGLIRFARQPAVPLLPPWDDADALPAPPPPTDHGTSKYPDFPGRPVDVADEAGTNTTTKE